MGRRTRKADQSYDQRVLSGVGSRLIATRAEALAVGGYQVQPCRSYSKSNLRCIDRSLNEIAEPLLQYRFRGYTGGFVEQSFELAGGKETLTKMQDAETTPAWQGTINSAATGFDDWIIGIVFVCTTQRPRLSLHVRRLLLICALAVLGAGASTEPNATDRS